MRRGSGLRRKTPLRRVPLLARTKPTGPDQGRCPVSAVDWAAYRKCPVCGALLGKPCANRTGLVVDGQAVDVAYVEADRPHGTRRLRTGVAEEVSRG